MFNNDVTKTYNHQDATLEIIVMLAGAFLLGFLICWLLKKLLNNDSSDSRYSTRQSRFENNNQIKSKPHVIKSSQTSKVGQNISEKSYHTPRIDDLTKISGINSEIESTLKDGGINSFTDLRDIKQQDLKLIQKASPTFLLKKKEVETWPHQASLAAKGDWHKLKEYQAFIQRAQIASEKVSSEIAKPENTDDLKLIEGIGPKIEEALNEKGIYTFQQLSKTDSITLKNHIVDANDRFKSNETESWPHQAAMAEKGQWDELNIYQEFMHSEANIETESDPKSSEFNATKVTADEKDHDDLKKIEGIGPKIEEVLNNSGIYTFSQLFNSDKKRLKQLLDDAGNQFRMHDPESWPHQAGMADRGEWEDLKAYQDFMDGGREIPSASATSSKASNENSNTSDDVASIKDDFKKLEGIGPKIEELLNSHNISTYAELAKSTSLEIKQFLDNAGPQYRLHEPESWPKQAKLASEGNWDKLEKLQDELVNNRR